MTVFWKKWGFVFLLYLYANVIILWTKKVDEIKENLKKSKLFDGLINFLKKVMNLWKNWAVTQKLKKLFD